MGQGRASACVGAFVPRNASAEMLLLLLLPLLRLHEATARPALLSRISQ